MTIQSEIELSIESSAKLISANNADVSKSRFICVKAENLYFENVTLAGTKITDANLSDLEIDGAQIGGAFIHNIGLPPEGHPAYNHDNKQRPVIFKDCDLNNSTFTQCDLTNVELTDCNVSGLKINGILIEDLLKLYSERS